MRPTAKSSAAVGQEKPLFRYNKEASKTNGRHGERDCYFVNNGEVSLYLSVENYGLEFSVHIAVADLKRGGVISDCIFKKWNIIKHALPYDSDNGEFLYSDKRLRCSSRTPRRAES